MSRDDYRRDAAHDTMQEWECMQCGYIHDGKSPPRKCPECGAGSDQFELFETFEDEDWDNGDYDSDFDDDF